MHKEYDWVEIQRIYDEGNSIRETAKIIGCTKSIIYYGHTKGFLKFRSIKDAGVISRIKYPYKCTEITKEILRQKRFEQFAKQTGESAWERKRSGKMSGLEQWFYDYVIMRHSLQETYDIVNEFPIYPYFIDFAFINIKLAVELDGKTHLSEKMMLHDAKKDEKLISEGWTVYRIPHNGNNEVTVNDFLEFLTKFTNIDQKIYEPSVIKYSVIKERKNLKPCEYCGKITHNVRFCNLKCSGAYDHVFPELNISHKRKCIWPTKEELEALLLSTSRPQIGKMYGVAETTVRKWIKKMNINDPHKGHYGPWTTKIYDAMDEMDKSLAPHARDYRIIPG